MHKRCDRHILYLQQKLDEALEKITALENEMLFEQERPTIAIGPVKEAEVYYMDDARVMEMEENGNLPT